MWLIYVRIFRTVSKKLAPCPGELRLHPGAGPQNYAASRRSEWKNKAWPIVAWTVSGRNGLVIR